MSHLTPSLTFYRKILATSQRMNFREEKTIPTTVGLISGPGRGVCIRSDSVLLYEIQLPATGSVRVHSVAVQIAV